MSGDQATGDLLLFVAGDAPRSRRAARNLEQGMAALGLDPDKVRRVDVFAEPARTLEFGLFATPALLHRRPHGEPAVLYGDLSDDARLHRFLAELPDSPCAQA